MVLHHRREMPDMRSAYSHDNTSCRTHPSDSGSERSNQERHSGSERSCQTQPTDYSSSPVKRAPHIHYASRDELPKDFQQQFFDDRQLQQSPRSSTETYTSTVPDDEEDLPEELPEYDLPEYTARPYESSAIAATPSDFSELFPSHRRLAIRHDDSTLDGNMNLRVDAEVSIHGSECDMTLFHLRMHDLKNREFSLRRYGRDSGREVCHSVRQHQQPAAEKRPGFQRSLSNALNSMRPKTEHRSSTSPTLATLKRNDSGYGSMHSVNFDEDDRPRSSGQGAKAQDPPSTNTVKLEFSNYAQVNVKRNGVKGNKRYEFEYWGTTYAWKRVTRKRSGVKEAAYHLTKSGKDHVLAYIEVVPLTDAQAQEEQRKGGWIPPCSMWIEDDSIVRSQKDLSDVVVASGLMALVDDCIRTQFHSKDAKSLIVPVPKIHVNVEYIGPKQIINEMFNRDNKRYTSSGQHSRPSTSSRPSTGSFGATGSRRPGGSSRQQSYEY